MSNYVHLIGAEDVQRAGSRIASAAEEMTRAASTFESSLEMHRRFLDDWLQRLEAVLTNSEQKS